MGLEERCEWCRIRPGQLRGHGEGAGQLDVRHRIEKGSDDWERPDGFVAQPPTHECLTEPVRAQRVPEPRARIHPAHQGVVGPPLLGCDLEEVEKARGLVLVSGAAHSRQGH